MTLHCLSFIGRQSFTGNQSLRSLLPHSVSKSHAHLGQHQSETHTVIMLVFGICRQAKLHSEDMKAITLTPTQSVEAMLKVIAQVKPEDSGKYLDYNGEVLPY